MRGYFDRLHDDGRTVSGWAYSANCARNEDLLVRVLFRGTEIGRGNPFLVRGDLSHITDQPAGFEIKCEEDISALDVLAGNVVVETNDGTHSDVLKLAAGTVKRLRLTLANEWTESGLLVEEQAPQPSIMSANIATLDMIIDNAMNGAVSSVYLPVGLKSPDELAILGHDGHLFLVGGSNRLIDLYAEDHPSAVEGASQWIELFDHRFESLSRRGMKYVQTVIPEKLTVLSHLAPVDVTLPTPRMALIEEALASREYYRESLSVLSGWSGQAAYRKNDLHLSAVGARECFLSMTTHLDSRFEELARFVQLSESKFSGGDLADRFFGVPILAKEARATRGSVEFLEEALELVEIFDPPSGHQGKRRVWTNASAPSSLRVLVFGNSFFGDGLYPDRLAWWFARFFTDFRFEWSPSLDYDVIDSYKPDVVIGQTIERFLPKVPLQ
jgi:hypothetical protein